MGQAKIPIKEQIIMFRQLGTLLQGGFSLPESLRTLSHQFKRKRTKLVIQGLINEVEKGQTFSRALLLFPSTFEVLIVSLVEVGEVTGGLVINLIAASTELQQQRTVKKKILTALIYPGIVVSATLGVVGLLIFYVFPKITPIFNSLNATAPLTTRLLVKFNVFLHQKWPILILTLATLGLAILFAGTSKKLKKMRHKLLLELPLIGRLSRHYFLSHFSRTLGQMLDKQVPIVRAVVITANSTSNLIYRQRVIALSMALNKGQSMTQFLTQEKLFSPICKQLIAAGEKTGTLAENLHFLADLYEQEINDSLTRLSVILEPIMMIVIGGVVGFVAISIITPIYQITQSIHV